MTRYRGHIFALIGCLVVQAGIYYGLLGLGAENDLVLYAEMIWLCAAVLIILSVGERIDGR